MNRKQMRPEIEYSTLNQVMAIGKVALNLLDRRLEAIDLSAPKLWAMVWIAQAEQPPTLTQLAECMSSAKSNITTLIDRLEKDGLVQRVDHPEDRRVIQVQLTPLGAERYAAGMVVFAQVNDELRALFTGEERVQFEQWLARIRGQLES